MCACVRVCVCVCRSELGPRGKNSLSHPQVIKTRRFFLLTSPHMHNPNSFVHIQMARVQLRTTADPLFCTHTETLSRTHTHIQTTTLPLTHKHSKAFSLRHAKAREQVHANKQHRLTLLSHFIALAINKSVLPLKI